MYPYTAAAILEIVEYYIFIYDSKLFAINNVTFMCQYQ